VTACALRLANRHAAGGCRRVPSTCERWDLAGCSGRAEVKTVSDSVREMWTLAQIT
jgi:hypothetical protein